MKAYGYIAYTRSGKRRTGTVVAESETDAAAQLARQDLFASEITARASARAQTGTGKLRAKRHRLNRDLQAVFTRQMAVMLTAELPVEEALEAVRSGGHPALDTVAAQTRAGLLEGSSLTTALRQSGGGFPSYYFAALQAGESAGDLSGVFGELADHLEQRESDRAQISAALIYPAFVAAVALLVCGILMTSVAPEIVGIFEMSGRPIPPLTAHVLALTDWIVAWKWPLLAAVAAITALMGLAARIPSWRDRRDRVLLRLPLIGRLMSLAAAVQYLRTLALVLGSRHAVLDAVETAVDVLDVARFRDQGIAAAEAVRHGEPLSAALQRLSFLPPVARQLVMAGERSVRLARMTDRAATLVEHRLSTERKRIATLLEPILMIAVGGVVLLIVLAVLLPIFDLQAVVAP
ncbi:type II secretion system F family protein [Maritimibacter alkaliphilus]|uniref:type II secretion system F family protein n=1 Tax=Maritimibacter alkaliphilus TaxID=404236 RepID=UPI001C93CEA1|nr:type II secretion system F family protein [Maritimibacter alkaliphilus]MBY6092503.1 type II secretion system F family protein [Maritimibacter alkaliphilus]